MAAIHYLFTIKSLPAHHYFLSIHHHLTSLSFSMAAIHYHFHHHYHTTTILGQFVNQYQDNGDTILQ